MPLLKLWNSIRGRSTGELSSDEPVSGNPPRETQQAAPLVRRPGLGIFGGGPHAGLCKLVRSVPAKTVLEISVEDGSRAIAVLGALARTQGEVSYVAIDPFDTEPGGVTLKQFHRTLRSENIRPKLFPGTIEQGLPRVACTVGTVDLVIIAAPQQQWKTATVDNLLARVSHPATVVLCRDADTWVRAQLDQPALSRAA